MELLNTHNCLFGQTKKQIFHLGAANEKLAGKKWSLEIVTIGFLYKFL